MTDAPLADPDSSAIAVIGMAGRFPGARSLSEFWNNLRNGIESIVPLSHDQLRAAGVDPIELHNPHYVKAAAVLDDIDMFDASFFGFSPKDAAIMDPQHRVFLECAWEALEHAGWSADEFAGPIGVYAGSGMNSYLIFNLLPNRQLMDSAGLFLIRQTGNDKDVLATRVSYQLNLTGPSMTVQTACSTSLVAVHMACQSLLAHECDMALAGGVTIEIPHGNGYLYREGEILSRDGHCRAFDAQSTGTVFGSGAGIVVLRRLRDALASGDNILAVIRGTAINNDGARKVGYLAPSVSGQSDVVLEALTVAGVTAESISYIETHGTGTQVGDPIEIAALTQAFRRSTQRHGFCRIGSLKTNIGHLDAAAGIAGAIKTILALRHKQIPPSLHFSKSNPAIDFENSPFRVNRTLSTWETNGAPRRAGVTSLGIGGTNAHIILEEAPPTEPPGDSRPWQILTISAKTATALESAAANLAEHLEASDGLNLADVSYTCHLGRKAFSHRRSVLCQTREDAVVSLRSGNPKRVFTGHAVNHTGVAFLFPGQGSQYVNMARGIYETEKEFRSQVDHCAELLKPQLRLDLRTALYPPAADLAQASDRLAQTWLTQPALFVIEFALAKLWMSWGICPDAMIGHSIGEFVAACVAGVLSLEDALFVVARRGQLMQSMEGGAMLAAAMPERDAHRFVSHDLSIGAINGPQQCVFSGSTEAIGGLEDALGRDGISCRRLHTSHAFHSAAMDPILERFADVMRGVQLNRPAIPYLSNITGTWIKHEEVTDPIYWARQVRQTVRFSEGLQELLVQPSTILLETGPGKVLSGLAPCHATASHDNGIFSSIRDSRENTDDVGILLTTVARLWTSGVNIKWTGFHANERRYRVPLPTYPFERQRFWIDAPKRNRSALSEVPLAGAQTTLCHYRPAWKKVDLSSAAVPAGGNSNWLIFADSFGVGAEIVRRIIALGEMAITVNPGKHFAKTGHSSYSINPGHRPDYEALVTDLIHSGQIPRRILHLWPLADSNDPILDRLERHQELSFHSPLFLAQALGAHDEIDSIELGIISNGLHSIDGEIIQHPESALLLGPGKVISKEFSKVYSRCIDIQLPVSDAGHQGIAAQLIAELSSESLDQVVAYRRDIRWTQTLELTQIDPHLDGNRLRKRGVYLITGGLGGVGLVIAEYLARTVQAKLVLVGRTELPPRVDWETYQGRHSGYDPVTHRIAAVQAIEKLGAEVLIVPGDVTDLAGMNRVVSEVQTRFGSIHGVVHAAGVLDDGLIQFKSREDTDRVLAPKVRGTLVLDAALGNAELDFFVLFSSISCWSAPVGQVDYVAANCFLNAFATARRSSRTKWITSINWPRWAGLGMAIQAPSSSVSARRLHPVLGKRVLDTPDAFVYEAKLSFAGHWLLNEHRLRGGDALFPGTGYIELARAALLARFGSGAIQLRNLSFNTPLTVAEGQTTSARISLHKDGDEFTFSVVSGLPSSTACATAAIRYLGDVIPPVLDLPALRQACNIRQLTFGPEAQNSKQARFIDFGPRWRCLKRIYLGDTEALSELELPEEFASDLQSFTIHPALLDAATGSAMFVIPDYELTQDLYVPVSYKRITLFAALPRKCYCHLRPAPSNTVRKELVAFDLTLMDDEGRVIAEAEEFVLMRMSSTATLSAGRLRPPEHNPVSGDGTVSANAEMSPQDGVEAFRSILASNSPYQIVVAPAGLNVGQQFFTHARPPGGTATRTPSVPIFRDAPRNDVERVLTVWWEELLGARQIGIHDDFFALGGHSLLAVRLLARIEKEFQKSIPLHVLFQESTIERMAARIHEGKHDPAEAIVPLSANGAGPALYCVHSLGGEVASFRHFASALGSACHLYGIQIPPGQKKPEFASSIETLASYYVSELLTFQPEGPYLLGGWSVGSTIALEMAHQLQIAGREVELLVALDGAPFNTNSGTSRWNPLYYWKLLRNLPLWVADDLMQAL
ncbi:MAG TPA: SDR family NAD(P)-dependent oxidoreductase, partial [Bryobacteraceae bacterium]|nr:SDR family NAD(P)-dependent oxidoreductase [Bryobacteraceae bacterium]